MKEPAEKLLGPVTDTAFGLDYSRSGGSGWGRTCFPHSSSFTYNLFIRCLCVGLWTDRVVVESVNLVRVNSNSVTYCDLCKWPSIFLPQFLCLLNSCYKILVPGHVVRTQWVDVCKCLNSALDTVSVWVWLSLWSDRRHSSALNVGTGEEGEAGPVGFRLGGGGSQQRRGEWRDRKQLRRREWDPEPSEPLIGVKW